jgi:hypothetical protein
LGSDSEVELDEEEEEEEEDSRFEEEIEGFLILFCGIVSVNPNVVELRVSEVLSRVVDALFNVICSFEVLL